MSVTDQLNESLNGNNNEPRLVLDLDLIEAQALRAWLLETEVNGLSAQDTPVVSTALAKLGRAVDTAQATINIRREFQQAGVNLAHWSDEQVIELGRRIAEAARPILNRLSRTGHGFTGVSLHASADRVHQRRDPRRGRDACPPRPLRRSGWHR